MASDNGDAAGRILDCVIVGGGPAGLTAAIYLGRFKRRFALIDAGGSRLRRIPRSRNVPGFPEGVEGEVLYRRMHEQASLYGALFCKGEVTGLMQADGHFAIVADDVTFLARTVLLATGVAVTDPSVQELDAAIHSGVIRYCPICDGYEAQGRRIAVLGTRTRSLNEAVFLKTYADDVTFLPAYDDIVLGTEDMERAREWKVRVETSSAMRIERQPSGIQVTMRDGRELAFDILYPCLGSEPRSGLLTLLGGKTSEGGGVITDPHQETSVPGLYAAGDVLDGLDQIASACGQAAIAATAIHNRLRKAEQEALVAGATRH